MLWLSKHARYRNNLSPYIDGQLSPGARSGLEKHLAACETCTRELEELRGTISAAGALPEAEPTRSFALTPDLLERERPRPIAPSTPPAAIGMRLAGAAVAVALAIVVVGDLGVGDNNGDSETLGSAGGVADRASNLEADAGGDESAEIAVVPAEATTLPEEREDTTAFSGSSPAAPLQQGGLAPCPAAGAQAGGGTAGGTGSGVGGAGPASSPSATAEPAPTLSLDPAALAECEALAGAQSTANDAPAAQNAPAEAEEAAGSDAAASPSDDGGISAWTVLEIVLAGALVALLIGIGAELLMRRRRAL